MNGSVSWCGCETSGERGGAGGMEIKEMSLTDGGDGGAFKK